MGWKIGDLFGGKGKPSQTVPEVPEEDLLPADPMDRTSSFKPGKNGTGKQAYLYVRTQHEAEKTDYYDPATKNRPIMGFCPIEELPEAERPEAERHYKLSLKLREIHTALSHEFQYLYKGKTAFMGFPMPDETPPRYAFVRFRNAKFTDRPHLEMAAVCMSADEMNDVAQSFGLMDWATLNTIDIDATRVLPREVRIQDTIGKNLTPAHMLAMEELKHLALGDKPTFALGMPKRMINAINNKKELGITIAPDHCTNTSFAEVAKQRGLTTATPTTPPQTSPKVTPPVVSSPQTPPAQSTSEPPVISAPKSPQGKTATPPSAISPPATTSTPTPLAPTPTSKSSSYSSPSSSSDNNNAGWLAAAAAATAVGAVITGSISKKEIEKKAPTPNTEKKTSFLNATTALLALTAVGLTIGAAVVAHKGHSR